jgi:hypothetical protein
MTPRTAARLRRLRPPRAAVVATLVLAFGGTLLFGALHAVLIEPIWLRLFGGLPFALLAAGAMTWCHAELVARDLISVRAAGGALFGAALWAALLPMTAFAAALRVFGLRSRLGGLESGAELIVAAATGCVVGFAASRSWRLALASAVCLAALVLAMAGPIAVTVGSTQRYLLIGFLPIYVTAGAALSLLRSREARPAS